MPQRDWQTCNRMTALRTIVHRAVKTETIVTVATVCIITYQITIIYIILCGQHHELNWMFYCSYTLQRPVLYGGCHIGKVPGQNRWISMPALFVIKSSTCQLNAPLASGMHCKWQGLSIRRINFLQDKKFKEVRDIFQDKLYWQKSSKSGRYAKFLKCSLLQQNNSQYCIDYFQLGGYPVGSGAEPGKIDHFVWPFVGQKSNLKSENVNHLAISGKKWSRNQQISAHFVNFKTFQDSAHAWSDLSTERDSDPVNEFVQNTRPDKSEKS